jgi:secreted PhoX family phosphatase
MAHTPAALQNSARVDEESRRQPGESFQEVLARRLSRRDLLGRMMAMAPLVVAPPELLRRGDDHQEPDRTSHHPAHGLGFTPIALDDRDRVVVPNGYEATVLVRWGDPLFPGVPPLDIDNQTPERQSQQFGFNNDYIGLFALPHHRTHHRDRALMVVNHEWTWGQIMIPGFTSFYDYTLDQVNVDMAAHGMTVVEIERRGRQWRYVIGSSFNRRITSATEMAITGPAAATPYLQTREDPTGTMVIGTFQGCGGGITPYGTFLSAEEGWMNYFGYADSMPASDPRTAIHKAYGIFPAASERGWERFYDRYDVTKEPNEPFRFGWVVEVDPYDPRSVPKKRTALGRLKRECAETAIGLDGRLALYMAEDQAFQCIYKFVTANQVDLSHRRSNDDLLDFGTLYVAKFNDDGTGEWRPLVAGQGALAGWTQPDVLVNTRGAAAAVGGTKMDKPEGIRPNPVTGKVYCNMTNNPARGAAGQPGVDAANPRANNVNGHVIEISEADNDPCATLFTWDVFIRCGNPAVAADDTYFAGYDQRRVSPISNPDNLTFDQSGNLWIATDGLSKGIAGKNDGVFATPVEGRERGHLKQFMSGPIGAELTGPRFTDDGSALFISVQHPGRTGTLANPTSTWPDGDIPRPSVVVVTRTHGEDRIGS